jgi:hypothetical protein
MTVDTHAGLAPVLMSNLLRSQLDSQSAAAESPSIHRHDHGLFKSASRSSNAIQDGMSNMPVS